jgi:hypothetical protein
MHEVGCRRGLSGKLMRNEKINENKKISHGQQQKIVKKTICAVNVVYSIVIKATKLMISTNTLTYLPHNMYLPIHIKNFYFICVQFNCTRNIDNVEVQNVKSHI